MHTVYKFPNSTSLCQLGTPQFPKFPNVWGVPSWIFETNPNRSTASAGGWICWMELFRCAIDRSLPDGVHPIVSYNVYIYIHIILYHIYYILCHINIILYHIYIYMYILLYAIYYISYCYILYIRLLQIIYTYITDLSRDHKSYELSKSLCWRSSFHGGKSTNQAGFAHDVSENKVSCNSTIGRWSCFL